MKRTLAAALLSSAFSGFPADAQYSARYDGTVVRLEDVSREMSVSILPGLGNIAFDMSIKGHNIVRFPYASLADFRGGLQGIPLMAPWANRLDEQAFYANGVRYPFDMELGNVRGAIPIHGFTTGTTNWDVVEIKADANAAWVTSRLEFFRQPAWMKQWPFAHTIEVTYRLQDGMLEVATRIENLSADPMPIAVGWHPYFQLTDSKREEWTLSLDARSQWLLAANKVPTGEKVPIERIFPARRPGALKDYNLDDVFGDLVRDPQGRATMSIRGRQQQVDVIFGPNYRAAVIYSPNPTNTGLGSQIATPGQTPAPLSAEQAATRNFVAIEPMAGITNALNMAQKGTYNELQTVAPGGIWQESFWVRASGF